MKHILLVLKANEGNSFTIHDFFIRKNVITNDFNIIRVPGAFEIPGMVKQLIDNKKPELIITLGVIVKGETNHFEQISEFVFNSISKLTISYNIPIFVMIIIIYTYKNLFC